MNESAVPSAAVAARKARNGVRSAERNRARSEVCSPAPPRRRTERPTHRPAGPGAPAHPEPPPPAPRAAPRPQRHRAPAAGESSGCPVPSRSAAAVDPGRAFPPERGRGPARRRGGRPGLDPAGGGESPVRGRGRSRAAPSGPARSHGGPLPSSGAAPAPRQRPGVGPAPAVLRVGPSRRSGRAPVRACDPPAPRARAGGEHPNAQTSAPLDSLPGPLYTRAGYTQRGQSPPRPGPESHPVPPAAQQPQCWLPGGAPKLELPPYAPLAWAPPGLTLFMGRGCCRGSPSPGCPPARRAVGYTGQSRGGGRGGGGCSPAEPWPLRAPSLPGPGPRRPGLPRPPPHPPPPPPPL